MVSWIWTCIAYFLIFITCNSDALGSKSCASNESIISYLIANSTTPNVDGIYICTSIVKENTNCVSSNKYYRLSSSFRLLGSKTRKVWYISEFDEVNPATRHLFIAVEISENPWKLEY